MYTQQCYMSYRFVDSLRAASCQQTNRGTVRNMYSISPPPKKKKIEKLVHLVGFKRIYHDARSPERQICIKSN